MCLGWRPNHSDLIHRDVFLGDGAQLCKNGHLGVHGKQPHQKIDKHSTLLFHFYSRVYSIINLASMVREKAVNPNAKACPEIPR